MNIRSVVVVMASIAILSCDGEVGEGNPDDIAREALGLVRLRRDIDTNGDEAADSSDNLFESAEKFAGRIYHHCQQTSYAGKDGEREVFLDCPALDPNWKPEDPSSCDQALCVAVASQCVAERLYAIGHQVQDFESVWHQNLENFGLWQDFIVVPPQSADADAALLDVASDWASHAIYYSGENLRSALGVSAPDVKFDGVCGSELLAEAKPIEDLLNGTDASGNPIVQYRGEMMLSTLFDATQFQANVAAEVTRAFSAVAESERSRNSSPAAAARYAWVEGRTSRARGAQVLLGGLEDYGLHDVPNGFGSLGSLSTQEALALEHIRSAGIEPLYLTQSGSKIVDEVVASYRAQNGLPTPDIDLTKQQLLSAEGLSESDFAKAGRWLDDAIRTLGLNTSVMALGYPAGRFAATSTVDLLPPDAALLARATRGLDGHLVYFVPQRADRQLEGAYALLSVAHSIDYAADLMTEISPLLSGISDAPVRVDMTATFDAGAQPVASLRSGRLELCSTAIGPDKVLVRYAGPEDELTVVVGEEQLRCLVNGSLHGAACSVTDFGPPSPDSETTAGHNVVRSWDITVANSGEPIFVVERLVDDNGVTIGHRPIVGSAYPHKLDDGDPVCAMQPVVPITLDEAATLIRPDPFRLDRAAVSCAGIPSDQRLPLEDELTDDGDGFESSWRHYLLLARAAADEADRLGEAVIENALDIERRVELASSELEDVCGGAVDIDFLTSMPPAAPSTGCSEEGEVILDEEYGYVCRGGVPVHDPLATIEARAQSGDPGAQELLSCLGRESIVPWVALGSSPLCLWHETETGDACVGAAEENLRCPVIKSGVDCDTQLSMAIGQAQAHSSGTLKAVEVSTALGIYATDTFEPLGTSSLGSLDGEGEERASNPPCDALRTIREPGRSREDKELAERALLRSPWFDDQVLAREARRLAWEALPYDHGRATRDGRLWYQTGDPPNNLFFPPTAWPCGAPLYEDLEDESGDPVSGGACASDSAFGTSRAATLACAFAEDCAATGSGSIPRLRDRVHMNQRIGRALLALRIITGSGTEDMLLPYHAVLHGTETEKFEFIGLESATEFGAQFGGYADMHGNSLGAGSMAGVVTDEIRATEFDGINRTEDYAGLGYCVVPSSCDPWESDCTTVCMGGGSSTSVGGCTANNHGYLWTYLTQEGFQEPALCPDSCFVDNNCTECGRLFAPCFTGSLRTNSSIQNRAPFFAIGFTQEDAEAPSGAIRTLQNRFWNGIGPEASRTGSGQMRAILRYYVDNDSPDSFRAVRGFDERDLGGPYWKSWNEANIMPELTYGDVMDGLELACRSSEEDLDFAAGAGGVSNDPCSPERLAAMEASGQADIAQLEEYLSCSASLIENNAERLAMRGVPADVVDSIMAEFGAATLPALEGQRGVLVSDVTGEMIALRNYRVQLARVIRDFANATQLLRNHLERAGAQRRNLKLGLTSQISSQIAACISAASPTVSTGPQSSGSSINVGAAVATCANTAVQIVLAIKTLENDLQILGLDVSDAFIEFSATYQRSQDVLVDVETGMVTSAHHIRARLAEISGLRNSALRSLGTAMLYSSDGAGRQLRVNTLLRRRFTTSQARYERAKEHALRMSYLAKLALEQRLGVELADLRSDMTLVEAPASWEANLCTMTGLNLAQIRDGEDSTLESYADQYIGDYVDRLERTAESYRLDFPFHEGTDRAIISLRDDILAVTDRCPEGGVSRNLVLSAGNLASEPWGAGESCVPVFMDVDDEGQDVYSTRDCIRFLPSFESVDLDTPSAPQLGHATPHHVRFGPEVGGADPTEVSARTTTRWTQDLGWLEPGSYMVSWFGREIPGSPLSPEHAVEVRVDGESYGLSAANPETLHGDSDGCSPSMNWCRFFARVDLSRRSQVEIALVPNPYDPTTVAGDVLVGPQEVAIGGMQFEDMARFGRIPLSEVRPTAYVDTDSKGRSDLAVCEDTDGDVFRSKWRYDCIHVCASGVRADCDSDDAQLLCYWERSFTIENEEFYGHGRLRDAGFALGSYNYRVDSIGVNFVGSQLRLCEGIDYPSECYGSGYANFSLAHVGPYTVINHQGERYEAPLFEGVIEYARGLASERYLTNPLSSADRALVEPYSRGEFRGRPLAGTYVMRVWDDGIVNFEALEDVQFVLDYRYWTRFR